VRYHRVNESTGQEVPWNEVVKAYEYDGINYVIVDEEDFKSVPVRTTKTIDIEDFVDRDAIDFVYCNKPYYLAASQHGEKGYMLLRESLKKAGKVGVAKVVIRARYRPGSLWVHFQIQGFPPAP
jgi:DNA end-binding protein Ku